MNDDNYLAARGRLIWAGKPAVSIFLLIYGIIVALLITILDFLEYFLGSENTSLNRLFPNSLTFRGLHVVFPVELATLSIILIAYVAEVLRLAILRASYKYFLYEDGLYVDSGIINLENTFLSPVAFSDARLFRTASLRLVKRGNITVDANDGRHIELKLVEKPGVVQALIRKTLGRPTVRVEGYQPINENFNETETRDNKLFG